VEALPRREPLGPLRVCREPLEGPVRAWASVRPPAGCDGGRRMGRTRSDGSDQSDQSDGSDESDNVGPIGPVRRVGRAGRLAGAQGRVCRVRFGGDGGGCVRLAEVRAQGDLRMLMSPIQRSLPQWDALRRTAGSSRDLRRSAMTPMRVCGGLRKPWPEHCGAGVPPAPNSGPFSDAGRMPAPQGMQARCPHHKGCRQGACTTRDAGKMPAPQ
jgi:hypothetical protein